MFFCVLSIESKEKDPRKFSSAFMIAENTRDFSHGMRGNRFFISGIIVFF